MKRDFDLIRSIMLLAEKIDPSDSGIFEWNLEGYDEPTVLEHVKLLIDAGYLDGNSDLSVGDHVMGAYVGRITMKGYDFLDNLRDETIWNKTKEKIQKTTGTASIEIVKEVAAALVRSLIFGS